MALWAPLDPPLETLVQNSSSFFVVTAADYQFIIQRAVYIQAVYELFFNATCDVMTLRSHQRSSLIWAISKLNWGSQFPSDYTGAKFHYDWMSLHRPS